ncbi:MAG TPA: isoleucine--tRNA ligase, partial [Halothiobacillaceae bacterium]|nr:isoleucine--tRNA ligase [Halothiobacillaceae bacterium]
HQTMAQIHRFCSIELGAFYLDIVKDRIYTGQRDALMRRSAQTAMWRTVEALTRWIAPVLSFTADEIWSHLPQQIERESSVFMATHLDDLKPLLSSGSEKPGQRDFWRQIMTVRDCVNRHAETARNEKRIKANLSAQVTIYADQKIRNLLAELGDELRFLLIVSDANVATLDARPADLAEEEIEGLGYMAVSIAAADAPKCARCWHHRPDVGSHSQHPTLCGRCIENIDGAGETRQFV